MEDVVKKAVIFDLDGTLVHTAPSLGEAINLLLERIEIEPLDEEHLKSFVGNGARNLVSRILEYFNVPESKLTLDEGVATFFECYDKTYLDTLEYPDVHSVLSKLKEKGIALCVLSNKPDKFVRPIAEHVFGEGVFDVADGAKAGMPHKPDPEALLSMLSKIGSDAKHCIYVGDSDVDVETAKRAGCACCAVDWGYRSREVLEKAGAVHIASDSRELLLKLSELLENL